MGFLHKIAMLFGASRNEYVHILEKQVDFLCKTSELLASMFDEVDRNMWLSAEREIKSCEVQGDALLTEFHEMLSESLFTRINRLDLQAVSMAMDDCLDVIKDTSKAIPIYEPHVLDPQLGEIARIATSQSRALKEMIPLLSDIKKNNSALSLCCEKVTELEHAADDAYEEYIGYIFHETEDVRELVKYKNIAEMLENETDAFKRISDNVRKLVLNYFS